MPPASAPSPSGVRQTPCWARRWGENVQWGMKAWSGNRRRRDLPMSGPSACQDYHPSSATSRLGHKLRPGAQPGLPVHRHAVHHSSVQCGAPPKMRLKVQSVHQHWTANPVITAGDLLHRLLGCWFSWQCWTLKVGSASVQSSGGCPQLGARGPGTGPTGLQFLSGYCLRWPGGCLQQSCRVYLWPPRKRK